MTSLIFWGPYLAHKSVINHRREKQRIKNYERWEGLRDEYDDQRKVARESRSLDIQRTGPWDQQEAFGQHSYGGNDQSYVSLRDQQEANDARTGWRPQESWEPPRTQLQAQMTGQTQPSHPQAQRHTSLTTTMYQQTGGLPLQAQKTGATWDEGLPTPLQVSRRSFDGYDHSQRYQNTSISSPASQQGSQSRGDSISRRASVNNGFSRSHTPSGLSKQNTSFASQEGRYSPPGVQITNVQELPKNEFGFVEPVGQIAGGRMAELIERGY